MAERKLDERQQELNRRANQCGAAIDAVLREYNCVLYGELYLTESNALKARSRVRALEVPISENGSK